MSKLSHLTLLWKRRAYGRDKIKKGFKQIRLEIFSLFLLRPASERKGAANAAERSAVSKKRVAFLRAERGCVVLTLPSQTGKVSGPVADAARIGLIIHWSL